MKFISVTYIFLVLFVVYVSHTIWVIVDMFIPPKCGRGDTCYASYLQNKPKQNLVLYTSVRENSYLEGTTSDSVIKVHTSLNFNYLEAKSYDLTLKIFQKTRQNGTLFMHAVLMDDNKLYKSFDELLRTDFVHTFPLITYAVPQDEYYNLLQKQTENVNVKVKKNNLQKTYAHISTIVPISILSDNLNLPINKVPGELYPYFKLRNMKFLPILQHNILKSRLSHLQLLNSSTTEVNVTVTVAPASYGTIRLTAQVGMAAHSLKVMGFTDKDVDEVKGIFGDTNIYLLSGTIFISSIHLLFDFLAFKNDVSFWRRKKSMVGLSVRTIYWRAFSQCVIFLYLLDENTTLLVLIPAGISTAIELWKVTKVLHIHFEIRGWRIRVWRERGEDAAESGTAIADREAMRYLTKLLYPLCIAGAIYSLVYESHKSWYSWAVHSTVNGVYAFGFLFMLPQLFVNYRLRSVAALPWRAFMYKAFNTVIDDVFAFIITMPTAHRVACFRDDLVFSIYLYQRWLYPVDKSRTDTADSIEETPDVGAVKQKEE